MKEYLMGLFVLGICCAVVEMLSPDGEGGGIARHIRLLSVLCLLCVLLAPVLTLLQSGESLPEYFRSLLDGWSEGAELGEEELAHRFQEETERLDIALAEQTVGEMLAEHFSLDATDCRVRLTVDESYRITQVRVALRGRAIWSNSHEIEAYIEQTFGCESVIYIE